MKQDESFSAASGGQSRLCTKEATPSEKTSDRFTSAHFCSCPTQTNGVFGPAVGRAAACIADTTSHVDHSRLGRFLLRKQAGILADCAGMRDLLLGSWKNFAGRRLLLRERQGHRGDGLHREDALGPPGEAASDQVPLLELPVAELLAVFIDEGASALRLILFPLAVIVTQSVLASRILKPALALPKTVHELATVHAIAAMQLALTVHLVCLPVAAVEEGGIAIRVLVPQRAFAVSAAVADLALVAVARGVEDVGVARARLVVLPRARVDGGAILVPVMPVSVATVLLELPPVDAAVREDHLTLTVPQPV
mmetsp:Transcript_23859/g.56530  ORF Transcript_23859/g.56530 Transcript_23859/m.56530 type:complete len:310 (-) Transcript_23859:498-1427(-)